jgi:hypothetical protein
VYAAWRRLRSQPLASSAGLAVLARQCDRRRGDGRTLRRRPMMAGIGGDMFAMVWIARSTGWSR